MIAFRPDYFLGYSVALDRFARVNEDMADLLRGLRLKAVIGTSESFPGPESAVRLSNLFGAPIAMEYGAVETNVIAQTHPSGGYRVFWRSQLVEAVPVAGTRHCRVLTTSLYPRCFPLVRYEIGDEIEVEDTQNPAQGVLRFREVIGRCNDSLRLGDGSIVHSEAFSHAVRLEREVRGFQVIAERSVLRLDILAEQLTAALDAGIRSRLSKIHPELGRVGIKVVSDLQHTRAGKTPMIVRANGNA